MNLTNNRGSHETRSQSKSIGLKSLQNFKVNLILLQCKGVGTAQAKRNLQMNPVISFPGMFRNMIFEGLQYDLV